MDKKNHKHSMSSISYCGKADSVIIECWCGEQEQLATWFFWDKLAPPYGNGKKAKAFPGWSQRQWKDIGQAIDAFLKVCNDARKDERHY